MKIFLKCSERNKDIERFLRPKLRKARDVELVRKVQDAQVVVLDQLQAGILPTQRVILLVEDEVPDCLPKQVRLLSQLLPTEELLHAIHCRQIAEP